MKLRNRIWLLLSQAVNALAFGGDPDESLSARAWREKWPKGRERLDRWLGKDHCERVYRGQMARQRGRKVSE